jgi:hypothetical protein
MLYGGPEEIDACPTADTQGHQYPVLRTGKSDALSDARAPEKKPVIVNWTTKSSVRSQRDKTAFLPNNLAILAELKVYREGKEHQQSSGRTDEKENLFFRLLR